MTVTWQAGGDDQGHITALQVEVLLMVRVYLGGGGGAGKGKGMKLSTCCWLLCSCCKFPEHPPRIRLSCVVQHMFAELEPVQ